MIYLLSKLSDPSLDQEMEKLMKAFDESGDFHPPLNMQFLESSQQSTREACVQLGTALLEKGQAAGRKYLWMATQNGQFSDANTASLEDLVAKMHR